MISERMWSISGSYRDNLPIGTKEYHETRQVISPTVRDLNPELDTVGTGADYLVQATLGMLGMVNSKA